MPTVAKSSLVTIFGHSFQSTLPFYELKRSEGVVARYSLDGLRYLIASNALHERAQSDDVTVPLALKDEALKDAKRIVIRTRGYTVAVWLEGEAPLEFKPRKEPVPAPVYSGLSPLRKTGLARVREHMATVGIALACSAAGAALAWLVLR